jgi:cysteine-rich repeat protein
MGRSIFLAATAMVVVGVASACGEPSAPELPAGPDSGVNEVVVDDCTGIADGTKCGDGSKICVRGACSDAACGDGIVTAPEECDQGAGNGAGSGCEPTCKFSCVSTDATRNCSMPDSCLTSTCDDAKHTCNGTTPKATGDSCGPNKYCKGVECVEGTCGDAVVTSPEQCDNGSANAAGSGCETTCKLTCSNAPTDCAPTPCNTAVCTADHKCGTTPDASKNGQACGSGLECKNGACIAPGATCGNGILETGEECDFGAGNGPGTGCETICKFSCKKSPNTCTDANACHVAPTCETVTVNGKTGQKCQTGATKSDGAVCGTGAICLAGICKVSACGDGYRDDARSEECDDGNVTKLDACSDQCKYEHDHRVISMKMQFDTDSYCTVNALGAAIGTLARNSFQTNINTGIDDGSVSALFTFIGDTTGQTGNVTVGNLSGAPRSTAPPWSGTDDVDWWYQPVASSIDAARTPKAILTGTYSGGFLNATGKLNLQTNVGGAIANLAAVGSKIKIPIGASTTPLVATGTNPPGHVAAEKLKTLQSFETAGGTNLGSPTAQMCGNILASSLDATLPPLSLLPGGDNACVENYSSSNRLLDIIVNGCRVPSGFGFNVDAIKKTQPDQIDPTAPVGGAGAPYTFTVDSGTKRVNGCKDKNGGTVALATCLNAAAYSMSFKFATDRVIIR